MKKEELMLMTISQLRGLDIKTKEDELLVQEVLNEKLQNEPQLNPNKEVLPSEATDEMTPEKEKELQAKLDGVVDVSEPAAIVEKPTATEEVAVVPKEVSSSEEKHFCEYCDSKGVRHKKNCTRLLNNENNDV